MYSYRPTLTAHTASPSIPFAAQQDRSRPSEQRGTESFDDVGELFEDLTQAYETNLSVQRSLRALVPETIRQEIDRLVEREQSDLPHRELYASIVFTDMKGSSALMEAHPVHQVLGILNTYSAIVVRIVQSHGGEVQSSSAMATWHCFALRPMRSGPAARSSGL